MNSQMRLLSLTLGVAAGLLLAGCGADGEDGESGPPGTPGVILISNPPTLQVAFGAVRVTDRTEVDFTVTDDDGNRFAGVEQTWLEFTVAKLVPGTDGDADSWQSYANRTETPTVGPGTAPGIQATGDSGGLLTNHGDGTYTYRFGTHLAAATTPLAVTYDANLTHRIGMRMNPAYEGAPPVFNVTHDFVPATGATSGIHALDVVATETCNECHNDLALHGGSRKDTKYCVTCHNPGSIDANSTNTVDFKVMIHKIHRGAALPSVLAGDPYRIWGFRNSLHDFSDRHYPQDIRNCTKCHDGADAATPQANNWQTKPTIQACGSCHDDVDFALGTVGGHAGGVATSNAECAMCHADGGAAGSVADAHRDPLKEAGTRYNFEILGVTDSAPGQRPVIRWRVTNPTAGNAAYSLTEPEWASAGNASSLTLYLAWDTRDYDNAGTTSGPASTMSTNALTTKVANGDGSFNTTFATAIPATATGSAAVALAGRTSADLNGDGTYNDRVPLRGAVRYFGVTDTTVVPRRSIVEMTQCQTCHGERDGLVLHGGSRTDNPALCVMCHNPSNTDIARRPADTDGLDDGINLAAADGLEEQSIDFKVMIHGIHGAGQREDGYVVYGFGSSVNDFGNTHFPGIVSDCNTCHLPGSFFGSASPVARGTTVDTGATRLSGSDDLRITATTAACSSCHDGLLSKAHMTLNGAGFRVLQSAIDAGAPLETCSVCHGRDRVADVEQVHGIR
jgi:OmcA/MtrC family decaheme c-type cytochrome